MHRIIIVIFSIVFSQISFAHPLLDLMTGEMLMSNGEYKKAAVHLESAIDSGMLTESGSASTYWSLHICYDKLKERVSSIESLYGYTVHANYILRHESDYKEWILENEIKERMLHASALINSFWASLHPYVCKDKLFACPIPTETWYIYLKNVYENDLQICSNDKKKYYIEGNILILSVKCKNDKTERYYFLLK